jgi:hypothetical protein
MELGDFHRHRRLASAFALVGVLLYSALIPGHVVSQATARALGSANGALAGAEFAFEPICHGGIARTQDPSTRSEPSAPQKKCPFCKGYASFMTAIAGGCDAGVLDAERASPAVALFSDGLKESALRRPHNRGPPLEL